MAQTTQPVIQPLAHPRPANKRFKFLVGGLVILAAVAYLIVSALTSTGAYYRTVSEVRQQQQTLIGKQVRVSGKLLAESIVWEPLNLQLNFLIADEDGTTLPVHFEGVKPDNMTEAAEVIVEGKLRPDGVMEAKTLLLKCPSRYEEGVMTEVRVESPGQ